MTLSKKQLATVATVAAVLMALATSSFAEYADAVKAYQSGDFVTAYREYLALAKAGDVRAQGTVACMIKAGEGVSSDPAKALPWFTKAAEKGLEPAQYSLGYAYENGVGTERDLVKALLWYGKAAQQGDAKAAAKYNSLEALHAAPAKSPAPAPTMPPVTGSKVAPTVKTSSATVKTPVASGIATTASGTAATGSGTATTAFGTAIPAAPPYVMPELVFENPKITWKRKAAEAGDIEAQLSLGWCYSTGEDVAQDKSEAVRWYRKAAESGRLSAQTALGWMYFSGEAGKQDLREAAFWYRKAAAQGDAKARKMLKRIERQIAKG
jgi:uncharacterized protein